MAMIESKIDQPFIIRMRSDLQPDAHMDVRGFATVHAARAMARTMVLIMPRHVELYVLETANMDDHGIMRGAA
mgnify:CR=1 FL=1